jgi:ABC-2 type transport system permease protein
MRILKALLAKEYRQIFRDRLMTFEIFAMPVVQLLILANAATFEVKTSRLFVVDHDRSTVSRELVDRFIASGRFEPSGASSSMKRADDAMLGRRADAILQLPASFEKRLVRDRVAPVQLVLNAEDGAAAAVTRAYASAIVTRYSAELGLTLQPVARTAATEAPAMGHVELRTRDRYNPELDYRHYMVPGILVFLITAIGMALTALNISREKEIGTLDQLNVTPVSRSAFIAAKLIPLWSIALLELAVGLLIARFVFGVPMIGSIPLVFGLAAVYLLAALGTGLWVSTIASTQQQALFIAFFIMLVYLLMSGLFTPVSSMPTWARWVAQLNPVKHFVWIMRAVLLKGAGPRDVLVPFVVLLGFAVAVFTLAVRQYSKRAA